MSMNTSSNISLSSFPWSPLVFEKLLKISHSLNFGVMSLICPPAYLQRALTDFTIWNKQCQFSNYYSRRGCKCKEFKVLLYNYSHTTSLHIMIPFCTVQGISKNQQVVNAIWMLVYFSDTTWKLALWARSGSALSATSPNSTQFSNSISLKLCLKSISLTKPYLISYAFFIVAQGQIRLMVYMCFFGYFTW